MSLDALHPFAGNHAIQSVAFVLEWSSPLDAATIQAIHGLSNQFRSSFPVVQLQQNITVQIDARKGKHHKARAPSPQLGGVQFSCPSGAGVGQVSRMIQVQRDNCVVVVNDYSRWEVVWSRVRQWLSVILPYALAGRSLRALTLQYHDLFYWRADPSTLDLRELFVPDSPFLPPNCYDRRAAWHSHHGFIDQVVVPLSGQVLDNVNVNVADVAGERQIGALVTHKLTFDSPIWSSDAAQAAVEQMAPMLHDRNKEHLNLLFSDAVKQKIGLLQRTAEA